MTNKPPLLEAIIIFRKSFTISMQNHLSMFSPAYGVYIFTDTQNLNNVKFKFQLLNVHCISSDDISKSIIKSNICPILCKLNVYGPSLPAIITSSIKVNVFVKAVTKH